MGKVKSSAVYRYEEFLAELRAGRTYGVFVDDTGSPGLELATPNLHPERKSWVAVLVPPGQMPEILSEFPGALEELTAQFGADEFHFAEIYAGRRAFKGMPWQLRMAVFRFMITIFTTYQFSILVQTLDPVTLARTRETGEFPDRLGPFNLRRQEDFALFLLLVWVKRYVANHRGGDDVRARVFVDEGFKQDGRAIAIDMRRDVFADGLICFAKSHVVLPIQLADFAAFVLNRSQLLLSKAQLRRVDQEFLEIVSPMANLFRNLETRRGDVVGGRFESSGDDADRR